MFRRPLRRCIAAVLLIGCSSGGSGMDPSDDRGDGDGTSSEDIAGGNSGSEGHTGSSPPCREAIAPIASLDEMHPEVGFSASDVLERVGGSREIQMSWNARDSGPIVKDGEETLTIAVEPISQAHRAMFCEALDAGEAAPSPPRLLIPVEVELETADGVLDERFETELVVTDPALVALDVIVEPEAMAGTLGSAVGVFYTAGQRNLIFGFTFTEDGPAGSILGPYSRVAAEPCRETLYAAWPPDAVCWTGEVAEPGDADALQIHLERANRTFPLTWNDGATSIARLTVELDAGPTCRSGEHVRHPVQMNIATGDGRADLVLPGWLHAGPGSDRTKEAAAEEVTPYYLQIAGARALDADAMRAAFGDAVRAVPAAIASVIVSTDAPPREPSPSRIAGEIRVVEIDRTGFPTPLPVGAIPAERNERCFDSAGEQRRPLFAKIIALDDP
jgi:hypothetical protein